MHASAILFALGPLVAGTAAHPAGGCKPAVPNGRALYTITNAADNAVVALAIGSDGLLSLGSSVATGGAGGSCVGADGSPNGPDALSSQSALALAGSNIFVVNAGSNTVSMFAVDPSNATNLSPVGTPAVVPGDFPNTVAASVKHKVVCVATTGTAAGVACAPYSAAGIGAMDTLRSFVLNQTNPPAGPLGTTSQAFFASDESTLFVTVKSDPTTTPPKAGFLAAFPVTGGAVSATGVQSAPNGTAVLFGTQPITQSSNSGAGASRSGGRGGRGGHGNSPRASAKAQQMLFATDASFGAAVLAVDPATGIASTVAMQAIDGQAATCWVAISPATNTAFVTDVAVNRLVEMSLADASIQNTIDLTGSNPDPGLTDIRAAGRFVYALSPGNGTTPSAITVVDAQTKKQVQHLDISSLGATKSAQGLAVLL